MYITSQDYTISNLTSIKFKEKFVCGEPNGVQKIGRKKSCSCRHKQSPVILNFCIIVSFRGREGCLHKNSSISATYSNSRFLRQERTQYLCTIVYTIYCLGQNQYEKIVHNILPNIRVNFFYPISKKFSDQTFSLKTLYQIVSFKDSEFYILHLKFTQLESYLHFSTNITLALMFLYIFQ